jgi:acetylornithine deacetylase/succinyl-diaminopimelate desuccinylase family protein
MKLDLIKTLSDLVALPSVNPMGKPVTGPTYFESRVTDYLENVFRQLGLACQRQTVEPGRDNIYARLEGASDRPLLVFEAHQDTVPVEGMTIDPWKPVVRDGRIYGRGACDIKGGLAAMLVAVARLVEDRPANRPTIILASTMNEEYGATGAKAMCKFWEQPDSLFGRQPDAVIVAEPTELNVVVAHKGVVRWRLNTLGRASHSSQPELGENAIYRMAEVLPVLERYARDVVPQLREHALCGRPTLSVGTIRGGISVNTVPDHATIEIDRRVLPGEEPQEAYAHAVEFLKQNLPKDLAIENEPSFITMASLSDANNGALADQLLSTARAVSGRGGKTGVPYGTNASATSAAGVPTVVFGPGSIAQAHTADEWLAIEQLELASEIYYQFAANGFAKLG